MTTEKFGGKPAPEVDLAAAARLVEALEQDLQKLGGDSPDIQRLRDEVQTLRSVLAAPIRRHHWVRDGLHGIREAFDDALDTAVAEGLKGSRYVAEIGRILGM